MARQIRRPQQIPNHPLPAAKSIRDIQVGMGLTDVEDLKDEIEGYWDVLLGRTPPPVEAGDLTLMEIANAYYSRAMEVHALIHQAEREGGVFKGSQYYRFRTGELRDFIEVAKRAQELGSRRLTQARLEFDMEAQEAGLDWSG